MPSKQLPHIHSILRGRNYDGRMMLFRVHRYANGQVYGALWPEGTEADETRILQRVPVERLDIEEWEEVADVEMG